MNKKIILIIVVLASIPFLDRLLYGLSDPFVSHIIVSSYLLKDTGKIESVISYLSRTNQYIGNGIYVWQTATQDLLRNLIIGATLDLYTIGSITGLDFKLLGYSPIIYFSYITFFLLISKIVLSRNLEKNRTIKLVQILALVVAWINFLYTYVFFHFIGFQYHAVALVFYLSFIFLVLQHNSGKFGFREYLILAIFYQVVLFTHYRFPLLILGSLLTFTIIVSVSRKSPEIGILYREKDTNKSFIKLILLLLLMMYFQPFYWSMIQSHRNNLSQFVFFSYEYIKRRLIGSEEVGAGFSFPIQSLLVINSYSIYINFLSYAIITIILLLLARKYDGKLLFAWGLGATLTYNLSYFLMSSGVTGIGIYDEWITILSLVPFMKEIPLELKSTIKRTLTIAVIILLIASTFTVNILTLYYKYHIPFYPSQPRYESSSIEEFVIKGSPDSNKFNGLWNGIVIGSSFVVSAELYEDLARDSPYLLPYDGFRRVIFEVFDYNHNKSIESFIEKLRLLNDIFVVTRYEENYGLSTDISGTSSYLDASSVRSTVALLSTQYDKLFDSSLCKAFSFT